MKLLLNASLGLLAVAIPLLSASNAYAAATCNTSEGVVTINDIATCEFQTSGGCTANCTPVNVSANCDAKCTANASASCTGTCQASCNTQCTTTPTTFTCQDYCSTSCQSSCMSSCTGDSCASECQSSCSAQCSEQCMVHPGSTDCTTECQDSCNGSCKVQANIQCKADCSVSLTGGCKTRCSEPKGALFCDGQFIDVSDITSCNFSLTVNGSASATTGCATAPTNESPFGAPIGALAITGLAMFAARRRYAKKN